MTKKWEQMTKNQKLDMLRAEVAKIMKAVDKLLHRVDDVERRNSKRTKAKIRKAPKKTIPPAPEPPVQQASE